MILKISKILALVPTLSFAFTADETTFSNEAVRMYLNQQFGTQGFLYENDTENETETEVATNFHTIFQAFIGIVQDSIDKQMSALMTDYAPLENYLRHEYETTTFEHEDDKNTTTYGDTVTNTYGQYKEQTTVSTYESGLKDEKSFQKGHLPNNNDTENHTGTTTNKTEYGDRYDTRVNEVHGNIGVMSSQQMLISELQVRTFNIMEETIKRFVREYCFTYWGC